MNGALRGLQRAFQWALPAPPAVFHVTHHKAGSQWINRILHTLVYERMVLPEVGNTQFLNRPIEAGKVYPTLYITREQFDSVKLPAQWKRFVVIRDLRDTLVSMYFSLKHSHAVLHAKHRERRGALSEMSVEDGLIYLIESQLPPHAQFQWSWVASGEELLKYEELLQNDEEILTRVLLRGCRLGTSSARFREAIQATRFEAWTKGRKPGEEDVTSHERKGVAGDWRNHFTDKVKKAFKGWYGSVLIATGYEKDFNW